MNGFFYYLILINALALLLMLADKIKAIRGASRIPEAALLSLAFLLGSFGCGLGMILFRHKTKKPVFAIGVPALLVLHLILLVAISL